MKRIVLFVAMCFLWTAPALAAESVQRFSSDIDVRADSSLRIIETVVYDMDGVQRHGWERIIPKQSEGGPRIVIQDVVATRDGVADRVNLSGGSDELVIRIGDPDRTITGVHTYVLSYTVFNEVRYFDDRDEVYWNAIPQGLRLPVTQASAIVTLPRKAAIVAGPFCYTGVSDSSASDCTVTGDATTVIVAADRPLGTGEGMTVAVAVSPGVIARVVVAEKSVSFSAVLSMFLAVIPFGAFLIAVIVFWSIMFRKGGLPRRRTDGGDIVVQYDPPAGCNAPTAAYLAGPTMTGRIFTAAVVQLAVEGWLKMRFSHEKKWYGKSTEILFIQSRDGYPEDPTLHQVMDALFIIGPERTITSLKQDAKLGAAPVTSIAAGIPLILQRKGFIATEGIARYLRRYTPEGNAVREHLAGLKLYLGAAEKARLEFHNAPEHSPQTFEKLLPYAIALGVDEPWTHQFGDLEQMPQWAEGDFSVVGMFALSEAMGDLSSGASSVMNAYASGTGGGSGGGGSSGGGGGGGGGGGW